MSLNGVFKARCHACNESLHVTGYCWNAACKLAGVLQEPIYKAEPLSETKEVESVQPAKADPNICEDEGCPHYGTPHGHDPASVVEPAPESANPIVDLVDDLVVKAVSMKIKTIREVMDVDKAAQQLPLRPQHIFAIHRDENNDFCLRLYFDRVPTDEEMRMTQNILNLSFKAAYLKKHHDAAGFPQQPKDSIQ